MIKLFLLLVVAGATVNALMFSKDVLSQVRRNIHTRQLSTRKSEFVMPRSNVLTNFTQRVDNFNPANLNTFEQRFIMNGEHFITGGPIIIHLSMPGFFGEEAFNNTMVEELGRDLRGYMFNLEHRYSGESIPTEDFSTENLRFLTVEQALADIAHFISFIKSETYIAGTRDSPVVLIGSFYAGSLAVWARQRYPHLIVASWASSAPLLAVANHFEFKELAGAVYQFYGGTQCYNVVRNGFQELHEVFDGDRSSQVLVDLFNLCDPLATDMDEIFFHTIFSEVYSAIPSFAGAAGMTQICEHLTGNEFESNLHALASLIPDFTEDLELECFDFHYEDFLEEDRRVELDAPANVYGIRQLSYLTCTQLGWFHSTDSQYQPFGNQGHLNVTLFYRTCEEVFGEQFNEETISRNIERFNVERAGIQPVVTNVVLTHGMVDAWRSIGVQESLGELAPVYVIQGAGLSQDLYGFAEGEDITLTNVKIEILELIRRWIAHSEGIEIVPDKY